MNMLIAALMGASAAQASATPPALSPQQEAAVIQRAGALGAAIDAFDRAAWAATDAMVAQGGRTRIGKTGGYLVEPGEAGVLLVTFYTSGSAPGHAVFKASVHDGKVADTQLLQQPVPLSPRQVRLARARELAIAEAARRRYLPCTPVPFNTVVLPPAGNDDPILVYLLSAQQTADRYPLGGSYRIRVGADGAVLSTRPYGVSCRMLETPKLPAGAKPVGLVVNHLLDPVPTEMHVLASYRLRMPLLVLTPDKRQWSVTGARITAATR